MRSGTVSADEYLSLGKTIGNVLRGSGRSPERRRVVLRYGGHMHSSGRERTDAIVSYYTKALVALCHSIRCASPAMGARARMT